VYELSALAGDECVIVVAWYSQLVVVQEPIVEELEVKNVL
jgi:hypothetical protein